MKKIFLVGLLVTLTAASCNVRPTLRQDQVVTIKQYKLSVQLAATPEQREAGLAGMEHISDTEGMMFIFSEPRRIGFWMKGVKFPLDILWLNKGKIIAISDNIPIEPGKKENELPVYYPPSEADRVIEVNAGWAFRHDVMVGDSVVLP
jgi:uncharacterized membrane protein (UPF0127 family)